MRIIISAIGSFKPGPLQELFKFYTGRLRTPVQLCEFNAKASLPLEKRKLAEAELLESPFPEGTYKILLDEKGRTFSSTDFAHYLQTLKNQGYKALGFMIGGPDGVTDSLKDNVPLCLALGPMTWPHLLVRSLLAEQLYRAESILEGHPYHRE